MIYDQTCAAEKRRRRKRGTFPDPDRRVVINELVCEGCGDCGVQSNCVAVVPVETEFGRKRAIDQSSCNKDFSCLKGFCPSFVTVHGAVRRKAEAAVEAGFDLPEPEVPALDDTYAILVGGIGGTGVVTIGALIAMAAHLEGKGAAVIDMAGLAQKGGAVTTHVRLAPRPEDIHAIRIAAGGADLMLGCDLMVAGGAKALAAIAPGRTHVIANTHETYPGEFTHDADFTLPTRRVLADLTERTGPERLRVIEATRQATALLGDSIATNLFMLGHAYQLGLVPVSGAAIEAAIDLNGAAVAMNKAAFAWGRRAAVEPEAVAAIVARRTGRGAEPAPATFEETIGRRVAFLTDYQNADYAKRYADRVARIRLAEAAVSPGSEDLTRAAATNLFKLMAIKDEYEVARLFTDGSFLRQMARDFSGWKKLEFHLAPPSLAARDPRTGHLQKKTYGPWMMRALRFLSWARFLRGTALDPFGRSQERRAERRLLADYQAVLDLIADKLAVDNHAAAVRLASYPEKIRGYGHVRQELVERLMPEVEAHRAAFLEGTRVVQAAE